MKPYQVFAFFLAVVGLIFGLQLLFPTGLKLAGQEIKIFNWDRWLSQKPINNQQVDAKNLLELQAKTDQLIASQGLDSGRNFLDSARLDSENTFSPLVSEFKIDSSSGIQYPAGDSTILYPFFTTLDSLKNRKELIRILHFGDSQIEGDRITGYVRQRFQQLFGGCGPGIIPLAEEVPSRFSVEMKASQEPERIVLYGKPYAGPLRNFSVLHSIFHLPADSLNAGVQFSYRLRPSGFQRANFFDKATVLFRNPNSDVTFSSRFPGGIMETKTIAKSDSFSRLVLQSEKKKNALSLTIQSNSENDFFGVCLDCTSGVAMDNIPLRGSSGLELLKMSGRFLKEQLRQMNVKLVILQFGVNVVPYDSKGYSWYESALTKAIETIKKASPGIQVLVIGVSDMARKTDGQWQSFPNIGQVKEAQRNSARHTNSAFWDLNQVMGGENSIQSWVGTDPPLAGKDYIHLTPKGAQVVGEFLFQSLIHEYQKSKLNSRSIAIP